MLILLDGLRWVAVFAGIGLAITALLHLRQKVLWGHVAPAGRASQQQTASILALGATGAYVAAVEAEKLGEPFDPWHLPPLAVIVALGLWSLLSRQPWERGPDDDC